MLPFTVSLVLNLSITGSLLFYDRIDEVLLNAYHQILHYYFYYWIGFILASIYTLIRYGERRDPLFKLYLIFLCYLAITVSTYYCAVRLGSDKEMLRTVHNYLFFVQFALLVQMNLKSKLVSVPNDVVVFRKPRNKYENSALTEKDLQTIAQKIKGYLESHTDYQSEDFSLGQLSERVNIPKHHISQAITDHLQTTFYELINSYRLSLFIRELTSEPDQNVANLSYQVGFKSRTTFYKYFKSKTGLTPSEYKGKLKQLSPKTDS